MKHHIYNSLTSTGLIVIDLIGQTKEKTTALFSYGCIERISCNLSGNSSLYHTHLPENIETEQPNKTLHMKID